MRGMRDWGGGRNFTLIGEIDRRARLPLSKWRGHGLDFFSTLRAVTIFQA